MNAFMRGNGAGELNEFVKLWTWSGNCQN